MIHAFLICRLSLILICVLLRPFCTALCLSFYCVGFCQHYDNGPSFDCVLFPSNLATTVSFSFDPLLPQPCQYSSYPVSSNGKYLLCLLSTVDNNFFSVLSFSLYLMKLVLRAVAKPVVFSEILTQPPLSSLLCVVLLVF